MAAAASTEVVPRSILSGAFALVVFTLALFLRWESLRTGLIQRAGWASKPPQP